MTPEQRARVVIDAKLVEAGWVVQDRDDLDLRAGPGVAVLIQQQEGERSFVDGAKRRGLGCWRGSTRVDVSGHVV